MQTMKRTEENLAVVSSDDEDEMGEDEMKLRSIKNLRPGDSGDPVEAGSLRRYDEYSSFLTRSTRSEEFPDIPPTKEELEERKVRIDEDPHSVHEESKELTVDEADAYFMTDEDFRRVDVDMELTQLRYEQSQKGKQKFDEDENTLRGLEEWLDTQKRRHKLRKGHRTAVLQEMIRQKLDGDGKKELDWNRIRKVAEPFSKQSAQIAYEMALADAGKPVPRKGKGTEAKKKKKKGYGLFSMFKKK